MWTALEYNKKLLAGHQSSKQFTMPWTEQIKSALNAPLVYESTRKKVHQEVKDARGNEPPTLKRDHFVKSVTIKKTINCSNYVLQ